MQTDRASLNKSNKNPYTLITLYLATIQDIGRRLVDLKRYHDISIQLAFNVVSDTQWVKFLLLHNIY